MNAQRNAQLLADRRPTSPHGVKRGWAARIFQFPLTWMVIGVVFVFLTDAILVGIGSEMDTTGVVVTALIGGAAGLVFYTLVMKFVARRQTPELAVRGIARETLLGMAIGTGFMAVSYLIVIATGAYQVTWAPQNVFTTVAVAIAVNAGAAVVEELTFRGLIFQAVEPLGGRWLALAVTAVAFGGVHLLNPGATLWSALAIAIEAGVLLGAAFLWRRNLWFVIGLHFAWNVVEGLFGIPVSGHRDPGLFVTTPHGAGILTGGTFGIEASVVPVLVSLLIAVPMLIASERRRRAAILA
ncbi:CPBP family intramembrane glutamic endopeptidase [Leifsonia sp. Root112D2]|uniref:CPBP family intramembrane glutamic endopeptidase n=1 Tax=Leifsonia sp. Root112D2 TaxID=1736426 RepID=UPI0009ECB317|nr:CPBP family intramembrane glutamic endopeptidase [Leifsonia sp. Root112D2]